MVISNYHKTIGLYQLGLLVPAYCVDEVFINSSKSSIFLRIYLIGFTNILLIVILLFC